MKIRKFKYQRVETKNPEEGQVVSIVGDAVIASTGTGDGKQIPLVILDTVTRPDLDEVIISQALFPPGDVVINWCSIRGHDDSKIGRAHV